MKYSDFESIWLIIYEVGLYRKIYLDFVADELAFLSSHPDTPMKQAQKIDLYYEIPHVKC